MTALCTKTGHHHSIYSKKYFKGDDFKQLLKELIEINGEGKIAIFCDNCSIHRTPDVRLFAKQHKIPLMFNLPYHPWFNGCELNFADWKLKWRKQLTILKAGFEKFKPHELLLNITQQLTP